MTGSERGASASQGAMAAPLSGQGGVTATNLHSSSKMGYGMRQIKDLVVDSGAIIRGARLENLAKTFWTVEEVLAEIRDKHARNTLKTLPYELKVREPSHEALGAVVAFAKKTGDFAALSRVDLRVIALAYMLERENHGVEHLRMEPGQKPTKRSTVSVTPGMEHSSQEKPSDSSLDTNPEAAIHKEDESPSPVQELVPPLPEYSPKHVGGTPPNSPCLFLEGARANEIAGSDTLSMLHDLSSRLGRANLECESEVDVLRPDNVKEVGGEDGSSRGAKSGGDEMTDNSLEEGDSSMPPIGHETLKTEKSSERKPEQLRSRILGGYSTGAATVGRAVDDDGHGWISENNYVGYLDSPFGSKSAQDTAFQSEVGCITTDFAMQNVLIQMGLQLVSLEGRRITRLKQWILRCSACFKTTSDMSKVFCPTCGSHTLERVSVSVNSKGEKRLHLNTRRAPNVHGSKYSIPKPKGGRQGDLLLREDQLMMGIWQQRSKASRALKSAFGEDVTYKVGINVKQQPDIVVGFGRKNPNAQRGRERRGKKKQTQRDW